MTTRGILYSRIAPVHIAQGLNVVYMVDLVYVEALWRPAFSSAFVSPANRYWHKLFSTRLYISVLTVMDSGAILNSSVVSSG